MKLKNILFLFINLLISISVNKEKEEIVYFSNNQSYNEIAQTINSYNFDYIKYIRGTDNNIYSDVGFNIQKSEYYLGTIYYNIPSNKIIFYLKSKVVRLPDINKIIQNNIYLYHSINKLGRT